MGEADLRPSIYAEVGADYRAIDDLRLRLLGLLPLATGTGIFLLLKSEATPKLVLAIAGAFGCLSTISLFLYELHGIEKCAHYIHRGQPARACLPSPRCVHGAPTQSLRRRQRTAACRIDLSSKSCRVDVRHCVGPPDRSLWTSGDPVVVTVTATFVTLLVGLLRRRQTHPQPGARARRKMGMGGPTLG